MNWYLPGAGLLYKLVFSVLLILIVLQYMFGTVGNFYRRRESLFYTTSNSTRGPDYYNDHIETTNKQRGSLLDILVNSTIGTSTYLPTTVFLDGNNSTQFNNVSSENITTVISNCPPVPPNLDGKVEVRKTPVPSVQQLEKEFSWLKAGGNYAPTNCQATNKVAIIVPYRARAEHLLLFLQHMHPFLRKQQIDYTIFIIEQKGDGAFNRAMLMNVGYTEALKMKDFDCFVFHDVDLLPEDDRNLYTCPEQPRHMSVAVDVFKYKLPYSSIFGGVSALTKEQFMTVNGFSNSFWGWGGEDDDMSNRIKFHNYHISRYPVNIARYTMLTHQKEKANPKRYENLQQGKKKYKTDGLVNLKYEVVESRKNLLYTWFLVNLRKPS